jgi:O-acetyl-ADP-ribose deacetylase (regulator of RNase III)
MILSEIDRGYMLNFQCNDITKIRAKVIVSSNSLDKTIGDHIDNRIFREAGIKVKNEYLKKIHFRKLDYDTLIHTSGGSLCDEIYYVYSPSITTSNYKKILTKIYLNILTRFIKTTKLRGNIQYNSQKTLAVPLLGTGRNKISTWDSAKILQNAYYKVLRDNPQIEKYEIIGVFYTLSEYFYWITGEHKSTMDILGYKHLKIPQKDVKITIYGGLKECQISSLYIPYQGSIILERI